MIDKIEDHFLIFSKIINMSIILQLTKVLLLKEKI
jgi:hypothetical protein